MLRRASPTESISILTSPRSQEDRIVYFFPLLTFVAILYFNLTPFFGTDCWWHMRFAEYFLEHGHPVIFDPFAVQNAKILATYPDLFPGLLFLVIYKAWSFIGLNVLRIIIFVIFIGVLLVIVRRCWCSYSVLVQILLLAMAMAGRVILQPDLFNYVLFCIWVYLLERSWQSESDARYTLLPLITIELIWVNTHPLFIYHGLIISSLYFTYGFFTKRKNNFKEFSFCNSRYIWVVYFCIINTLWIFNPLGWRAMQSLFVNMLDPSFTTPSTESFRTGLSFINTYLYFSILILYAIQKPWQRWRYDNIIVLRILVIILLAIPSFAYDRCLPFLSIYIIMIQYRRDIFTENRYVLYRKICMISCVILSIMLFVDRNYVVARSLAGKVGIRIYGDDFPGIGVQYINRIESVREAKIIDRLAEDGNCLSNSLGISSCAVWFCRNKPVFMHGHAAVINARHRELQEFLSNLTDPAASSFLLRHDIRTVVLTESNQMILLHYPALSEYLQLVYMDPYMAILVRRDTITTNQDRRLKEFYASFQPGVMDAMTFNPANRVLQYVLLWFSAEMTGNDGRGYLSIALRMTPKENLEKLAGKLQSLVPMGRRRTP